MTTFTDPYSSSRETTEGTVFSVTGGDWNEL
jgi:NADH-quinone oxidoreductase subunit D